MQKIILTTLFFLISFSQTGPAGLGSSSSNILWLKSGVGLTTSAGSVSQWDDQSGNLNHLIQPVLSLQPKYQTNQLNSYSIVNFTADQRLVDNPITNMPDDEITMSFVVRTTDDSDALVSYAVSGQNNEFLLYNSANLLSYLDGEERTVGTTLYNGAWNIITYRWQSSDGSVETFLNGTLDGTASHSAGRLITSNGSFVIAGEQDAVDASYQSFQQLDGDFAELSMFNFKANEAQRNIIENYLSSKFNIAVSNDLYSYDALYGSEVSGLGRESSSDENLSGVSDIINVSTASLADGEYLLYGHNKNGNSFSSTDIALLDSRISKVWRVDKSGVTTTNFTVEIDTTNILLNSDQSYRLLVDSDGIFSTGVTEYIGSDNGSGLEFTSVVLSDGDFISIGRTVAAVPTAPISLFYSTNSMTLDSDGSGSSVFPTIQDGGTIITNYSISSGGATGISINATTGVISVDNTVTIGTYILSVSADNVEGSSIFTSVYTITVNPISVDDLVYSIPSQQITMGTSFASLIATPTPVEPSGGTYTYSWDLGSNPYKGISLNTSTGEISGVTIEEFHKLTTVTLTGSDDSAGSASATLYLTAVGSIGPGGVGGSSSSK